MPKQSEHRAIGILVILLGLCCRISMGQSRVDSGSACGLYCLFAITEMFDKHVDIRSLVTPMYVTSNAGSTLADLKHASTDHGLYAIALGNMTEETLRNSPNPVILHVRKSLDSKIYDHWIICLGVSQDLLTIYDPPNAPEEISFNQLSPLWDGNGLVVAKKPIDVGKLETAGVSCFIRCTVVVATILLLIKLVHKRGVPKSSLSHWLSRSAMESAGIIIVAACMGVCYQVYRGDELLASTSAESLANAYDTTFMPRVTIDDLKTMIEERPNIVLIDARYAQDYQAGHIPDAISIPVNSTTSEIRQKAKGLPSRSSVIVYCQSSECGFAEVIASELRKDGLGPIMLYPGGWMEWEKVKTKGL
jgi:rhodanese-related sulfurtransferase/predicted double-glycine peptidase